MAKPKKEQLIRLLNGSSIASKLLASIIRLDDLLVLLNAKGHQIGHFKLSNDTEGKTPKDADELVSEITESGEKAKDPFISDGHGGGFRCSTIQSIEEHDGRDFQGVIVRGLEDAVLGFIPVTSPEVREKAAIALGDALESWTMGKLVQPNLAEFFNQK
nr:hypothetical protein [uncultured Vibrio sp.]